ncbi:Putative membrane protein [Planktothrix tepida]|uniref:Membrane protein n=2 Tax=Planktothrix TaxID=54304 RepID=A0A9W4CI08_9CYAN|nr:MULTISPECIES: DUF1622 domain-containing protein [Planktothrix]CAD5937231.1 Putative membrane protein [Planktothrix pseudagardhii]CAD5973153.1 Putative membrane protein [Planktothrix tepida]CUR34429.1 putative membrane protein [Planktothrix tepida PCC 9214]
MVGLEPLENSLFSFVHLLRFGLEAISAFCVFLGLITTLKIALKAFQRRLVFPFIELRLHFGTWLALALEFQLGADIVSTTITPSFQVLGQLAAIAVIRTFLNYFLNKELESETNFQKKLEEKSSIQEL